jgi:6-phosphofructo-2-kinase
MTSNTSDAAAQGDQRNMHRFSSNENNPGWGKDGGLMPPAKTVVGRALGNDLHSDGHTTSQAPKGGVGTALTDTPISTAPPSPQM